MDAVVAGGGARVGTGAVAGNGTVGLRISEPDADARKLLFGALATGAGIDVALQAANGSAAARIRQKTGPTRIAFPLHEPESDRAKRHRSSRSEAAATDFRLTKCRAPFGGGILPEHPPLGCVAAERKKMLRPSKLEHALREKLLTLFRSMLYVEPASRPDGRRSRGGKSGLHGDTVPDNVRRGKPQGKRHRKGNRLSACREARVKRCGKSAPRGW
jgi:hypothetical protein